LDAFKAADDVVFVAYLNAADQANMATFAQAAEKYRLEFTFGVVTDALVAEKENAKRPSVRSHRHGDGAVESFGFEDEKSFNTFILETSRPAIAELMPHNHQRFLDVSSGSPVIRSVPRSNQKQPTKMIVTSAGGPWSTFLPSLTRSASSSPKI
jgi:hypothetical protein